MTESGSGSGSDPGLTGALQRSETEAGEERGRGHQELVAADVQDRRNASKSEGGETGDSRYQELVSGSSGRHGSAATAKGVRNVAEGIGSWREGRVKKKPQAAPAREGSC